MTEKPLRNKLIIDIPKRMGCRTKKIARFRWEYIDFEDGSTLVQDRRHLQLFRGPSGWNVGSLNGEIFHLMNSLASVMVGVFFGAKM